MKKIPDSISATVVAVLEQFAQNSQDRGWIVEQLDEGAQARVFTVRLQDGRPIWKSHRDLVVKLYKPTSGSNVELARGQFESLAQVHTRLDGRVMNGWKIWPPAPLYRSAQPLALVMTMVPGRSLNSYLEADGRMTSEVLESIAQAIAAAMHRFWSVDSQIYGDLNFDNVLCDCSTRSLSFVDSGVVANSFFCDGVTRRWYPVSRDLAYMLFDTGVAVKRTLRNPSARARQQWLVERVLRAFLQRIDSAGEQGRLLDEIQACAHVYLKRLRMTWSPRGLWCAILRRITSRRIDAMLGGLRPEGAAARMTDSWNHDPPTDVRIDELRASDGLRGAIHMPVHATTMTAQVRMPEEGK